MPHLQNLAQLAAAAAGRTGGTYSADFDALCIDGQHVAIAIGPDGATYAEQKANAAFIALACETHHDLAAMVRELVANAEREGTKFSLAKARAILAAVSP